MPTDTQSKSSAQARKLIEEVRANTAGEMSSGLADIADTKENSKQIAESKKRKEYLEADLKAAQGFRFASQDLRLFVRDLKDAINVEIHAINDEINNIDSSINSDYIEHLRETKAKLAGYKDGLDQVERDRVLAESTADLDQAQTKAETYKTKATRRAKRWRSSEIPINAAGTIAHALAPSLFQSATPTRTNPTGATPPPHGGPSMGYAGAAGNGGNTGETPEEKEARYKAEIKVTLVPLANSTDNSVIKALLTGLKDNYGQGRVSASIRELRQDTGDSKFDVMLSTFQNIVANRPQNPAP